MPARVSIPYPDRTLAVVFPFSKGPRISRREFSDFSGDGVMVVCYEPPVKREPVAISFRLEGWHQDIPDDVLCQKVQEAFERELAEAMRYTPHVQAVKIQR